jgi:hypothetical protein
MSVPDNEIECGPWPDYFGEQEEHDGEADSDTSDD